MLKEKAIEYVLKELESVWCGGIIAKKEFFRRRKEGKGVCGV